MNESQRYFPLVRTVAVLLGIFVLTFMLPIGLIHAPAGFWLVTITAFLCLTGAFSLVFAKAATTLCRWILSLAVVAIIAWFAGYGSACIAASEEERGRYNSPFVHEILAAPGLPGVLLGGPGYDLRVGEIRSFRFSAGTANAIFWLVVIPIAARFIRVIIPLDREYFPIIRNG
ncbi:MAG: hypothetical protein DVB27_05400 [Verrucomicrobia bacterium]|jgi:hypothetical protein|nr:MAG: hypothetical protein DVB27_05400 [Verrucomicrobiota bacterium]